MAPQVVTASRRTDLVAHYAPWLVGRLRAGFCHVLDPYGGRVRRVSLRPDEVLVLVLFTRDPRPLLPELPALLAEGYRIYAHVTLTGYPRYLEPAVPSVAEVVPAVHQLAEMLGPRFVVWRYDPILLGGELTADWHRRQFAHLAAALAGAVEICSVAVLHPYRKTERALARLADETGWRLGRPGASEQVALGRDLLARARSYGIRLRACVSPGLVAAGIDPGACVDPYLIAALRPDYGGQLRRAPTRPGCRCAQAVDLGAYDTCVSGCVYCYATRSAQTAAQRWSAHDTVDSVLFRPPRLRGINLDRLSAPAEC